MNRYPSRANAGLIDAIREVLDLPPLDGEPKPSKERFIRFYPDAGFDVRKAKVTP